MPKSWEMLHCTNIPCPWNKKNNVTAPRLRHRPPKGKLRQSRHRLVVHFDVGNGRLQLARPVDQTVLAVDERFVHRSAHTLRSTNVSNSVILSSFMLYLETFHAQRVWKETIPKSFIKVDGTRTSPAWSYEIAKSVRSHKRPIPKRIALELNLTQGTGLKKLILGSLKRFPPDQS